MVLGYIVINYGVLLGLFWGLAFRILWIFPFGLYLAVFFFKITISNV